MSSDTRWRDIYPELAAVLTTVSVSAVVLAWAVYLVCLAVKWSGVTG